MVTKVLHLVYREVRGLHQAAYILALFAFISQLLAIVRDRLLAHTFGAGGELDVYYAAFRLPDLLFVLFASALSVFVLLPFVMKKTQEGGEEAGGKVLSQMFTLFLIGYAVVAGVLAFTAPVYMSHFFPGLTESMDMLILLTQVLLLQPLLLGLSSLCGVVTQMNHRFILYAISPLLYNVCIIIGIIAFYPYFGLTGLVIGVVLGALLHLLVQVPYIIQSTYTFRLLFDFDWKLIFKILAVAVPRALTISSGQVVMLVLVGMATLMTVGSVSVLHFAHNLQSVPLAIIGASYSVAAFPTLSSLFAKQDQKGFNLQLLTAFRHIIFWSIPIIVLVIVLRAQIVRVLLGSGEFDWNDTRLTAAVLAVFIVSLAAQAIAMLLIRAFYACGRTITPLWVALLSGGLSILFAIWFNSLYAQSTAIQLYIADALRLTSVAGTEVLMLVLAFVCGQLIQLVILMLVSVKFFNIDYGLLWRLLWQSMLAGLAGGIAAYGALRFLVDGVNQETFMGIMLQGLVAGLIGVGVVILVYHFSRSPELAEVIRSFKTKFARTPQADAPAS